MVRRISNPWCARVSDQGDALAFLQQGEQTRRLCGLVVVVIAEQGPGDAVMREELASVTGVLSRNEVDTAQDAQRPEGNVLQVANGGRDDIQRPRFSSGYRWASIWAMQHVSSTVVQVKTAYEYWCSLH